MQKKYAQNQQFLQNWKQLFKYLGEYFLELYTVDYEPTRVKMCVKIRDKPMNKWLGTLGQPIY